MSSQKFADVVVDKLRILYELYEDYISRNDDVNLTIMIGNNKIDFHLFSGRMTIDECTLSFNNDEKVIYEYISIKFMINLFKNVVIHNDKIIFYNDKHMPFLKVVVLEDEMIAKMRTIMGIQENDFINEDMEIVTKIKKKIPRRYYSNKDVMNVNNRIMVSKMMLG